METHVCIQKTNQSTSFCNDDATLSLRPPAPCCISSSPLPTAPSAPLLLPPGIVVLFLLIIFVALLLRMAQLKVVRSGVPPAPQALAAQVYVRPARNVRPEGRIAATHLRTLVVPTAEVAFPPNVSMHLAKVIEDVLRRLIGRNGYPVPHRRLRPVDLVCVFRFWVERGNRGCRVVLLAWLGGGRLLERVGLGGDFGRFDVERGEAHGFRSAFAKARRRRRCRNAHSVYVVVVRIGRPSTGVSGQSRLETTVDESQRGAREGRGGQRSRDFVGS